MRPAYERASTLRRLSAISILLCLMLGGAPAVLSQTQPYQSSEAEPAVGEIPPVTRGGFANRFAPVPAPAGWYVIPFLALSEGYDSNVFDVAANRTDDFITRLGLGLALGYLSDRFRLFGGYGVEGQWFAENSDLNDVEDRQFGRLDLRYTVTPRLTVGLSASYERSDDSASVTTETGVPAVEVGRTRVDVFRVSALTGYRFTAATSGELTYAFTHEDVSDLPTEQSHEATIGLRMQFSSRDLGRFGYRLKYFDTENDDSSVSQALLVGYARRLGPGTDLLVDVGPRYIYNGIDELTVDGRLELRHQSEFGSGAVGFRRSDEIVVGLTGPRTVNAFFGTVAFRPLGVFDVVLGADVSLVSAPDDSLKVDRTVYGADVHVGYRFRPWLLLRADYRFVIDENSESIKRHVVQIGFDITFPILLGRR